MSDETGGTPGFSPFDMAIKTPDTNQPKKPGGGSGDVKIENITDRDIDGPKNPPGSSSTPGSNFGGGGGQSNNPIIEDVPGDAPEFRIPNVDEVPSGTIPGGGGAFSGAGGGGGKGPGSGNSSSEGTKVPEDFSKEFSGFMAKWIIDMWFKLLIMALSHYSKIDKSEVLKAVNAGTIEPKFVKLVEEINNKIDRSITVTEEEKKFVVEPLKYFLEVKKVNIKPEYMFAGGLLMVSVGVGLRAHEAKKESKEMLDQIMRESAKIREENRMRHEQKSYTGPREQTETFHNNEPITFSVENNDPPPAPGTTNDVIEFPQSQVEEVDPDNT